ncbi:hypothetical protein ACIBF1_19650 [Spirillospora sp. NPDC050679]
MKQIQNDWSRVTTWLRDNAPLSHARLRPGADPARVGELEEYLGHPLHPDHRALLEVCDGTVEEWQAEECLEEDDPGMILDQGHLLSVDGIRAVRVTGDDVWDEWWRDWVPVTVNDYSSKPESGLAVDPSGVLDRFALYDGTAPGVVPSEGPTLAAHVAALAQALETGTGPLTNEWTVPGVALDRLMWGHPAKDKVQVMREDGYEWVPWRPVRG